MSLDRDAVVRMLLTRLIAAEDAIARVQAIEGFDGYSENEWDDDWMCGKVAGWNNAMKRVRAALDEAEGLCPNGCAPVTESADGRERTCPVCGYIGITTRIGYNG